MAEVAWTLPALNDLDAIADYIAFDNEAAARALVRRVFRHTRQLGDHPESGPLVPELEGRRYRQIVEPPVRVLYRHDSERVWILHVLRGERRLRPSMLTREP